MSTEQTKGRKKLDTKLSLTMNYINGKLYGLRFSIKDEETSKYAKPGQWIKLANLCIQTSLITYSKKEVPVK